MESNRSDERLVNLLDAARDRVAKLEAELVTRGVITPEKPEESHRFFFENTADAIFIMDGDTFVDCNSATVQMFGFDEKEQLLEMHPSEVSPPLQPDGTPSYDKANEMVSTALQHGGHRFEWDHIRADGEIFPAEVLLTPITNTGVRTLHAVVRDISQRKELETQLRQSQKMEAMGRLAGGIAHDFNNLLMIINASVEKLLERNGNVDRETDTVRQIGWAGQRASELTGQLLAASRRQVLQPRVLDFNKVAEDAHGFLRRLIGENIELSTIPSPLPVRVKADPGLMDQVIINLATNARDAMPEGGTLTLEVTRRSLHAPITSKLLRLAAGNYVRFRVIDTGIGMQPDVLESALDPFFTTKAVGDGSGLGLSMVYGIIGQSGGQMEIRSDVGQGTTVEIWFPAVDEDVARTPVITDQDLEGDETILVVEDDESVGVILAEMLTDAGYRVLFCSSGLEALNLWEERSSEIDLIITDVVMPHMGGPEFIRHVRSAGATPPVIFASGYTDNLLGSIDDLGFEAGYLQKPFNRPTLLRSVRNALTRTTD